MDVSGGQSKFDQMIFELLEDYDVLSNDELQLLKAQAEECGSVVKAECFANEDSKIIKSIGLAEWFYSEKGIDLELLKEGLENELKTGARLASFMEPHLEKYKFGNARSKSFKAGQILSVRVVGRQKAGYTIVDLSTKMHGFLATENKHKIGDELKVHFVGSDQGTLLVSEDFVVESQDISEAIDSADNVIQFRRKENPPSGSDES